MPHSPLDSLFEPKSVAVFGASTSSQSVGTKVFANLVDGDYSGPVIPINPKHRKIGSRRCYSTLAQVPEDIDLAVIATPANTVEEILHQCGEAGVGHAIVLSAGFNEIGEDGRRRTAEIIETARRYDIRFLGPNCVGLVRPSIGLNATFLNSKTPPGKLALVSQSGALCSAISDWAEPHHLGLSALVSLGNSANIGFGDVVNFLAEDPATSAILLYVEGVMHARSFISALRAATRVKPVIVLKAGRHQQGSTAASTHTGALTGSDAVFDAALERAGAVRAHSFGQLFAAAEILSADKRANGRRLAIVTNGGGAGVLAADRAGDLHLELPKPSDDTLAALDALLPPYWSRSNPVDILGDAHPDTYAAAVRACLTDPNFDGVLVMLTPQAMSDATDAARSVLSVAAENSRKPLLACWMGETSVSEARKLLSARGIPDFTTPEQAVEAFSYLARHDLNRKLALETPEPRTLHAPPDIDGARLIIDAALSDGRTMLSDIESKAVLRAFQIPSNTTMEADGAAKALVCAETLGFPVVLKINSPQITHKSDVGGVQTNIMTAADVHVAYRDIVARASEARPDAEISGVTVEAMVKADDVRELLVGVTRDPVFGPSIVFSAGGTMVEILRDSAVSLPPLNDVLAGRLVDRTRVSRVLAAFRDRPAVNKRAVIDVLLKISDLVCEFPQIESLDINPLFAGPEGVVAVDARIQVGRPKAGAGLYDHLAISPYPRHLVQHDFLSDGTSLTIRPIRPEDAESEQSFVRALSDDARRFRFMHALKELTPAMLVRFTQIDYDREMALVAVTEEDGQPIQHGVARYVINSDETSCEFAIVVSDRKQHQGIGTRLMKALMECARGRGLKIMQGTVLAENKPMLQLVSELGFRTKRSTEERDVCNVEYRL